MLLITSLVPLAVSAFLIRQIAEVAQNFASNQAAQLRPSLERSKASFGALIETKKELFAETATRISLVVNAEIVAAQHIDEADGAERSNAERIDGARLRLRLDRLLSHELEASSNLLGLEIIHAGQPGWLSHQRSTAGKKMSSGYRVIEERRSLDGERQLVARFAADLTISDDLASVASALRVSQGLDHVRRSLPSGYVIAFLALVGGVVLLVTIIGILVARRLSRRVQTLLDATRMVARGDLEAHVDIPGRDELAELGNAFNAMVEDLRSDREQIRYLQRIGAWQDVARRLAHEIKNPLTPIGLAMQQVVSSYRGNDEHFAKILADADEIVGEEITSLKRLVDAFSALGRLPRVDAAPLDFAVVMNDLGNDPILARHIIVDAPDKPVTVAGDRLLLRRLLSNLVENGIQAGEKTGMTNVVVRWRPHGDGTTALLTVEDGGRGIDPESAGRLFEPYVTNKETGTGLGLAIAKKIALEHGGSLEIDPQPSTLGGARIRLRIPLA